MARTRAGMHAVPADQAAISGYAAMLVLIVALALACALSDRIAACGRASRLDGVRSVVVTVGVGDSLWSIAESHPVADLATPALVEWIREHNALSTATILPGERLLVPCDQ